MKNKPMFREALVSLDKGDYKAVYQKMAEINEVEKKLYNNRNNRRCEKFKEGEKKFASKTEKISIESLFQK